MIYSLECHKVVGGESLRKVVILTGCFKVHILLMISVAIRFVGYRVLGMKKTFSIFPFCMP